MEFVFLLVVGFPHILSKENLQEKRLASTGEASDECLHLWELLECSICDPHVGVQPGSPVICASLCDRIYDACSNAYFAMDAKTQVLAPCGISDTVCGRASEWVSNGTELCKATGFSVKASNDFKDSFCYGGKASLESVVDSWRTSHSSVPCDVKSSGFLFDFQQWVKEMSINEQVSWAVGGLVLTAGLLFISKRKSHNQRRLSAVQRTARKLGGKTSPKYPASSQSSKYSAYNHHGLMMARTLLGSRCTSQKRENLGGQNGGNKGDSGSLVANNNDNDLHAYLGQYAFHANEVRLMDERNSDPLALVATHQMTHQPSQQPEFPQLESGLTVPVFKQGDDPIDAINHMMSILSAVVTSRYPTTNNQLILNLIMTWKAFNGQDQCLREQSRNEWQRLEIKGSI
nr:receptor-interacting serine/threonine-protein kinase [Tanacetum cinerariifolium]